jgi:hypothetical protein
MSHKPLSTVVLVRDLPEHHLRAGDIGAIVGRYDNEAAEVEFVTGSGRLLRSSHFRMIFCESSVKAMDWQYVALDNGSASPP